ncbi:hypothetical protein HYX13_00935 [Candidatus Woesearchaeota archaeon]|nr:hypothetical protein [Candidatus Woesearchaeota archaeon]
MRKIFSISERCAGDGKKAQMEIIGLVVVVILITLGLLFLAIFALRNDEGKKVEVLKGLATSTMGALMKSSVSPQEGCAGGAVTLKDQPHLGEDILEDCAVYFEEYGEEENVDGYSDYHCASVHSCNFFQDTAEKLLASTLGEWQYQYEFHALLLQSEDCKTFPSRCPTIISFQRGNCLGERESSGIFPLQTEAGEVISELWVC